MKDYKEAIFSARDADPKMWLQQFGYLEADNTNLLQHYHTVDGLLIPLISQLKLYNSCALGKHSAYSYRMSEIRRASEALKLGHTEVNGRVTEVFFERALYRMLLMYDFSRYFSFYLLKYGSDAWRCLAAFRSFAERRPGQLLKHVRSEHGGSFISKAFGQYRLWERVEECVVELRDVVFNESGGGIIGTADADRLNASNGANEVFAPDVPAPPSSLAPSQLLPIIPPLQVEAREAAAESPISAGQQSSPSDGQTSDSAPEGDVSGRGPAVSQSSNYEQASGPSEPGGVASGVQQLSSNYEQASGPSEPGGVASGVQQLRRSTRPRHAPTEWWSSSVSYAHVAWQEVPKTFSSTHVSSDVHEWQAIGESELPVVPQTYCALPLDMESVRCRLLHEMSAEEGLYGAPIRQIAEGYNSDEVLAPHANNMSAHVLSGFEAAEDVEVTTLDVKTVFQRVELERELLMHKDQSSAGISQTGSTGRVWVCRLRESLYSLEQVSRFWPWSVKINSNLKSLGYAKSVFALGVAVYKAADWLTVMIVYADSLMTYSEGRARGLLKSSADSLRRAELTELGVICSCLAISVVMYRASGVLYSSQVGSVMTLPTMLSLSEREPIGCIPDHKLTTHLSPITPIERKNMAATR